MYRDRIIWPAAACIPLLKPTHIQLATYPYYIITQWNVVIIIVVIVHYYIILSNNTAADDGSGTRACAGYRVDVLTCDTPRLIISASIYRRIQQQQWYIILYITSGNPFVYIIYYVRIVCVHSISYHRYMRRGVHDATPAHHHDTCDIATLYIII